MDLALKTEQYVEDLSSQLGEVLPEHVEAFWRDGFVKIENFMSPELCDKVVDHFREWSGIRWKEWPSDPAEQEEFRNAVTNMYKRDKWFFAARQQDPWLFNFVTQRKFGKAAAKLLKVPAVKILSETLHTKLPEASGFGKETTWHQDYPYLPIDRGGKAVQTWLALVDIDPEMGPMQHLLGSHRSMPGHRNGNSRGDGREDARVLFPEVFEQYKPSELKAVPKGSAVFHHSLTYHYAPRNYTNRVRWAMSSYRISADCLYTGAQNHNTDGLGLAFDEPLNHPNFPTIYSE